MILAPDRTIVVPGRATPRWRRRGPAARPAPLRHRPGCPLFGMADGQRVLVGGGKRLLAPDGRRYLKCCCAGYRQARRCIGGAYVDLWIPAAYALPFYFQVGTDPNPDSYYVDSSSTTSTTPGALAESQPGFVEEFACECECADLLPYSWLVSAAGVTICTASNQYRGDPNGSWCVPFAVGAGGAYACSGRLDVDASDSGIEAHNFDSGTWDKIGYTVRANSIGGVVQASLKFGGPGSDATTIWSMSVSSSGCHGSGSEANAVTSSAGCGVTGHYGYGGTIAVTSSFSTC